ncbi:MAG TPA: PIG-L deacetylase family protein [Actinomycetota bacterium]
MKFDDSLEFDSAMVIFAHPDDAEWMCAGTVAAWTGAGVDVTYLLVTNGASGSKDKDMTREKLAAIRIEEQRAACDVLGVKTLVPLGFEDGYLYPDLDLRKAVAREVRRTRPEVVIAHDPTVRTVQNIYFNHPDHIAVGEVSLRSINPDASSGLMFPELWHEEGFEPFEPKAMFLSSFFEGDVLVDITATMDRKIEALMRHESQVADPAGTSSWARDQFKLIGARGGYEYAEAFRRFTLGIV